MCELCRSYPCKAACPNSNAKPFYYCDKCGGSIDDMQAYYLIDIEGNPGFILCEKCCDDCRRIAERED